MQTILHITTKREWQAAARSSSYQAPSLASDGFIHCSTAHQVTNTANAFYRGVQDLVLLVIDESAVTSPVKYEPPADAGEADRNERFPHIYGPLNVDAVVRVLDFPPNPDGTFSLPDGTALPNRP